MRFVTRPFAQSRRKTYLCVTLIAEDGNINYNAANFETKPIKS